MQSDLLTLLVFVLLAALATVWLAFQHYKNHDISPREGLLCGAAALVGMMGAAWAAYEIAQRLAT
jgi:uncharacterized membrane protein YfcA